LSESNSAAEHNVKPDELSQSYANQGQNWRDVSGIQDQRDHSTAWFGIDTLSSICHPRPDFPLAFKITRRGKRTKKMPEADKISPEDLLRMTSEVAAAYVSNNPLAAAQLPEVIRTIHASLAGLQSGAGSAEPLTPAVPVKKSVHDDYIVCLEDGKKLKMLKRHLRTAYGLTPEDYRQKWGLPADYPMVAPNYAAQRSAFAKKIGLGRTGGKRRGRGRR
jgi:predicted transcriptional regulator